MTAIATRRSTRSFRATSLLLAILMVAPNGTAFAAPAGGRVVSGSGSISNPAAGYTRIDQQSQRLAIDWQSFDVAVDERVQFVQPDSQALALNRILDGKASEIFGKIDANGRVILQNSHGILFGRTAMLDTGALVATTLNVDLEAFARGDAVLVLAEDPETAGAIVNQGVINAATGGSVALIGGAVSNDGVIAARLGRVDLAAGSEAVLTFDEDNLIGVRVSKDVLRNVGAGAAVSNSGEIVADGGLVMLSAAAARELFDTAVNNSGVIEAMAAEDRGGRIFLTGSDTSGNVVNSGTLDASGSVAGSILLETGGNTELAGNAVVRADSAQGAGGSIALLGSNVGLFDSAQVSASGAGGGGNILVGGDYQGGNTAVRNATATYIGESVSVRADATEHGNGGRLIVWADDASRVYGDLSAVGGAQSGNGGFIETSGHEFLDVTKTADVTAANGLGGNWLLDPRNLTVTTGTGSNAVSGSGAGPYTPNNGTTSTISVGVIEAALTGGANVTLQSTNATGGGTGDIIWNDDAVLDYNGDGTNTLTLNAFEDILFNGRITDSVAGGDALNIVFTANDDILIRGNINTGNGNATLTAGNNDATGRADTLNRHGIIFADDDSGNGLTAGLFGQIIAGGDITLDATGGTNGTVTIAHDPASVDAYGTNGVIRANGTVTINTPRLLALDTSAAGTNFEIIGNNINLNVAEANANTTQRLDIAGATTGPIRVLNLLNINDGGVGDMLLHVTYDQMMSTNVLQGANEGGIDITYNDLGTVPADGAVKLSSGATQNTVETATIDHAFTYTAAAQTLNTIVGSVLDIDVNSAFRNTLAGGDIDFTQGNIAVNGATLEFDTVETSVGAKDAKVDLFVNGGTLLSLGGGSNIQGDLFVANNVSGTAFDQVQVAGDVTFDAMATGASVQGTDQFLYGGVLNGTTTGGMVDLYVTNVGTINTSVGGTAGGNIDLQSQAGGNLAINALQTRDAFVQVSADGDLGIGQIDTTMGGGTGAGINLLAGQDDGGSNNNIGVLTSDGIISISGGDGADIFALLTQDAAVSLSGAGGSDTVNINARLGDADNFLISSTQVLHNNGGSISGSYSFFGDIETLALHGDNNDDNFTLQWSVSPPVVNFSMDGGTDNDIINGRNQNTNWNITGAGSGNVDGAAAGFLGIEQLTGGTANDSFFFHDGGGLAFVNGGAGGDALDYSNLTSGNVLVTFDSDLAAGTNGGSATALGVGFAGIDKVQGRVASASANELAVTGAGDNSWGIDGIDKGGLTGDTLTQIDFDSFGILTGGDGDDAFTMVNPTASVTGSLAGGGGDDSLSIAALTAPTSVNLETGTATGVAGFAGIENFTGTGTSTLIGQDAGVSWSVTGIGSGQADLLDFTGFDTLVGGSGTDTFTFNATGDVASVQGGGGYDTISFWSTARQNTFTVTSANTDGAGGDADGIAFQGIDSVLGANGYSNQLAGTDADSTWTLGGIAGGNLSDGGDLNLDFGEIYELTGGDGDDTFVFQPLASTAVIDGGAGDNEIDFSGYNENINIGAGGITSAVTLSTPVNFLNIDTFTADADQYNTLNAPDGASYDVSIYGTRALTVDDGVELLDFVNFDAITTGDGNDNFYLDGGSLTSIDGGVGVNQLYGDVAGSTVTVDSSYGGMADGIAFGNVHAFTGQGATDAVTVQNGGSIDALYLGAGNDVVTLESGSSVSGDIQLGLDDDTASIDFGAAFSGLLYGDGGDDTLAFTGFGGSPDLYLVVDAIGSDGFNGNSGAVDFNDIDTVTGDGEDDFLTLDLFSPAVWNIAGNGGTSAGDVTIGGSTLAFDGFGNIHGSYDDDQFNLSGVSGAIGVSIYGRNGADAYNLSGGAVVNGLLDGGAGSDIIDFGGDSRNLSWNLTSYNGGTVSDIDLAAPVTSYADMENLGGAAGNDTFVFSGGQVSGTLDGAGGSDRLDYSALLAPVLVAVDSEDAAGFNGDANLVGDFRNIDRVIAPTGQSSSLIGMDVDGSWLFDGTGGHYDIGGAHTLDFANFEFVDGGSADDTFDVTVSTGTSLNGNAGDDLFILANGVSVNGILGGTDTAGDTVRTGSANDTFSFTTTGSGAANGNAFGGIEVLDAGTGTDTLAGNGADNIWNVSGNDGDVAGMDFLSMENLTGGLGNDTFNLSGAHTGNIGGGDGDDTFSVASGFTLAAGTLSGGNSSTVDRLEGDEIAVDAFVLTGTGTGTLNSAAFSGFEMLDGGSNAGDTLTGTGGADTFNINSDGAGTVVSLAAFEGMENLRGGAGNDTFHVLLSGAFNGSLYGDADNDAFLAYGDASVTGVVDGGTHTTADTLDFSGYGSGVNISVTSLTGLEALIGSSSVDTLTGTAGNDTITLNGSGTHTFNSMSFSAFENVDAAAGDDNLVLAGGFLGTFLGGADNDTISAQAGVDTGFYNLHESAGNDGYVYDIDGSATLVSAFDGVENLAGNSGHDEFYVSGNFLGALAGNAGDDLFVFDDGTSAGSISGGTATTEDVLATGLGSDTFTLTGTGAGNLNGSTGFSGIERLSAGAGGTDVLNGTGSADAFNFISAGSVTVTGLIAADGIESIHGAGGSDTLNGGSGNDIFTINGADAGSLSALAFTSIENLAGNAGDDTFNYESGGSLAGGVSGGTHTAGDQVSYYNYGSAVNIDIAQLVGIEALTGSSQAGDQLVLTAGNDGVTLASAGAGTANGIAFSEVEDLLGNGGTDTLTGTGAGDGWVISSVNAGEVKNIVTFTGFANLTGAGGDDAFEVQDGARITGLITGGGGYDNMANQNAGTWTLSGAGAGSYSNGTTTAFTGIEVLTANGSDDVVVGTTGADVFNLNASGAGSIAGVVDLLNFRQLQGGNGNDRFLVNNDYQLAVTLSGGSGDDSVEYAPGGAVGSGSTFDGGSGGETLGDLLLGSSGNDAFQVNGSNAATLTQVAGSNIERLDGGAGVGDTLTGSAGGDIWNLANSGSTVAGMGFAAIENVTAGNGANTFNIGTYTGNITGGTGADLFVLNGALTGSIDGNSGTDELQGTAGNDSVQLGATVSTINGVTSTFTNIEVLTGNGGTDTLTGIVGGSNAFYIDGANSGSVGSWDFSGFANLAGSIGNDTFDLAATGRVSGSISGGGGSDTVSGTAANAESWDISGAGTGSVTNTAGSTAFTGITTIDGAGGGDSLLISAVGGQTVNISGSGSGGVGSFLFAGMTDIDAGVGADIFNITGAHTGNLSGSAGDDEFRFNGGSVSGNLLGGTAAETLGDLITGSSGSDTAVIAGAETGTFNSTGFTDIERMNAAGGAADTLSTAGANTWNLGGGTDLVSGIAFSNFESVSAGNGADTFNIDGLVGFDLLGNGGDDVFNLNSGGSLAADAFGGAGDDTFNFNGGSISGSIDGGTAGETLGDLIVGTAVADAFTVTGTGSGTVNSTGFADVERLNGGDGSDTFSVFETGSVTSINGGLGNGDVLSVAGNVNTTINGTTIVRGSTMGWTGVENLLVGTSGASNITIGSAVSVAGDFTLGSGGGIATTGGSRISAATVNATASGGVDLYTNTASLDVATSAASNVSVDELDGLTSVRLQGNNVSLTAGGAVADADAALDINATTAAVLDVNGNIGSSGSFLAVQAAGVDSTSNGDQFLQFNGNVGSLNIDAGVNTAILRTSSAAVTVDQGALDQITAGALALQTGSFLLDGNNAVDTLAVNTDGAVLFDNGSNDLAIGTVGSTAGITTVNDAVDLAGGNIDVNAVVNTGSARFSMTASGNIAQTAAITAGSLAVVTVSGDATLDGSVDTDTFAADVDGDLVIVDADGFNIATVGSVTGIGSSGFTAIDADGAVTDSAAIAVNGLALTGSGPYTLDAVGNSFGTLAVDSTGTATLTQSGALAIGTVNGVAGVDTGAGNFVLNSSGGTVTLNDDVSAANVTLAVTGSGGIGGTGTVTAGALNASAVGNIALDTVIDTLVASSSTGSLVVTDAGDLTVDNASAATSLDITAAGSLTVEEVSAANASLTATAGDILDGNGGSTNITASTIALGAADIGTVTDFAAGTGDALEVSGLAAGGLLVQGSGVANILVSGNYTAGNDDVQGVDTLLLSGTGNLDVSSGLAVFATGSEIGLGAGSTLTLPTTTTTAAGSVLQVSGNDIVAAGGSRTLDFNADTLHFVTGSAGGAVTLTGDIGTLSGSAADDLTVDVDSALVVDGLANSNGFIDITVASGDATLLDVDTSATDDGNNDIVVVAENGDIVVGELNAGAQNDVSLTASGSITDIANTVRADRLDLDAGGDIGESSNAFNTGVNLIAAESDTGNIWIEDEDDVTFENLAAGNGGVTVTSTGDVTVLAASAGTGGITLDVGSGTLVDMDTAGDIDVTSAGDIAGTGDISGVSVSVVSTGGDAGLGLGTGSVTAGAGGISISGDTDAVIGNATSDGDVVVTATTGDAVIGTVTTTAGNGGDVVVSAGDAVTVNGAVDADNGVSVTSGGDAALDNIVAGAGGLTADIGGTAALGDIVMEGGAIDLVAADDVVIDGLIETAGGASGGISIESTGGGILMEMTSSGDAAGITEADGATIDLLAQGDIVISIVDAGATGTVNIVSTTGTVTVNERSRMGDDVANITAATTNITGEAGIGNVSGLQLVIDTSTLNLQSNGPVVDPILLQDTDVNFDGNLIPPLSQLLGNLSFDPELEGLAYLDPAIFTAVGNYATDEDALELPEDQKVAGGNGVDDEQPVAEQAPAPAGEPVESAQAEAPEIPLAMN
ncbi:MAG: filamentous hemagglutinin N-terminal domain-containing protein [Pseudomonadota bacterium]